jgi:hypothetical protein
MLVIVGAFYEFCLIQAGCIYAWYVRVLDLFLRVTSLCTIPTVESTWPSRRNYFGFRHVTMATERRRPLPWSAAQQHPK